MIFLTCRDEEEDMLGAFSAGADDYVVKPFPMRVLMKRIQAVLHRCRQEKEEFLYKGLKIRFDQKKVYRDDQEIFLTPKEYRLLEYMVKKPGAASDQEPDSGTGLGCGRHVRGREYGQCDSEPVETENRAGCIKGHLCKKCVWTGIPVW